MVTKSKLLAGAAAAAALIGSTAVLAAELDAKGSVYGDLRYGFTYFNDDVGITAEDDLGDNGSFFGIKASTTAGDVTAFAVYERAVDTDDCINAVTGIGTSTTTLCQGNGDYVRQAFGGIKTTLGTVTYGHQETMYSQMARRFDPFFNTGVAGSAGVGAAPGVGASHGGSVMTLPIFTIGQTNNQLNYISPQIAGFTANLAYFSNEDAGTTDDPDMGIGADFSMGGLKAGVQHLRIRSALASSTPNFAVNGGAETDLTAVSVGYAQNRFGAGLLAERFDDRTNPVLDGETLQLSGWFGVVQGTRIALAAGMTNEYFTEGRSVTVGVFHDVIDNFTAHVAATRLEGDADSGTPDAEAITLGASYKFDLGFNTK